MSTSGIVLFGSFVAMKAKPGADILTSMTAAKADLWHAGSGVSTEAGELLEGIQTYLIFDNLRDDEEQYPDPVAVELAITTNLVEELGDILFYTQMIRNNIVSSNDLDQHGINFALSRFMNSEVPPLDPEIEYNDALMYYAIDTVIAANVVLDLVKKTVVYNKGIGWDEIIRAVNDVDEFVVHLSNLINVSIADIEDAVRVKLDVRYQGSGYSDNEAIARADKAA